MERNTLIALGALFLVFSTAASADVTVQQALADGCYDNAEMQGIIEAGKNTQPQGTRTLENEEKLTSTYGGKITHSRVTAPGTWVYRAYEGPETNNWHVQKLKEGIIYSKGQNSRDKFVRDHHSAEAFWNADGPDLLDPKHSFGSATYITMRLLAIQSSDTPPSQFVSFALDYNTTKTFGDAVYALQVNPDSQILGLVDCKREKGEVQVQVLGGKTFAPLYRKVRNENDWKRYDQNSKLWVSVPKGTVPE